jgi:excisionase family DNA binding protein
MSNSRLIPERAAFSVAEAAVLTGIGRDGIYAAIRQGQLRAKKLGRRTVIRRTDLDRFLADLPPLQLPSLA